MMLSDRFQNDAKPGIYLNALQENALYHFKNQINDGEYIFETYDCDCGCKYEELVTIAEKDRYGINVSTKICPKCGILMTNPRINQDGYNKFYDSLYRQIYVGKYRPSISYYETQRKRGKRILEFVNTYCDISEIKSVLEIGCSAGGIVSAFRDFGVSKCKGIDLGSEYIAYGIEQGLDLENCSSSELIERKERYDLIILNHVFEHFLDVKNELAIIRELLTDDGILYIEVPGVMDIHNGYQGDFLRYLQNAHVRHFSHDTLGQMLKWNGFDEIYGDETVRSLFKKGNIDSKVTNFSDVILDYLERLEKPFEQCQNTPNQFKDLADRRQRNVEILSNWLALTRRGKRVGDYFKNKGIFEIAIYGWGFLGKQLWEELKMTSINVAYIIDKNEIAEIENVPLYKPSNVLPNVNTIVIATSGEYNKIKQTIGENGTNILTIQDIINELMWN